MHAVRLIRSATAASLTPMTLGSDVFDNAHWANAKPRLSVVVPTFRVDCSALIAWLKANPADVELVVYDDGSCTSELTQSLVQSARQATLAVRIVSARRNKGRAGARNAAARHGRADWVLLLDSDMLPDDPDFIARYLEAAEAASGPCLVVGGYSLDQLPVRAGTELARRQALTSECLPASARSRAPGRYVFTSNMMVHRDILAACPFDESFAGWGWEDTEWGLRVAGRFPVSHIDNTATHLGVDDDAVLMAKYARSGENFARLVRQHPTAMDGAPLLRAARLARRLPFRRTATALAAAAARGPAPLPVRAAALKVWRALVYAEHL